MKITKKQLEVLIEQAINENDYSVGPLDDPMLVKLNRMLDYIGNAELLLQTKQVGSSHKEDQEECKEYLSAIKSLVHKEWVRRKNRRSGGYR